MKKRLFRHSGKALLTAALVAAASAGFAAAFTPGNLVVMRTGDGTNALAGNVADAVFLDEYTTAGSLVQTVSIPTTTAGANFRCTLMGLETAVGALNRSADGQYLTFGGYDAPIATAALSTTAPGTNPRVIARVSQSAAIDTSTIVNDGFARFASVISDDGTHFWSTGNTNGVVALGGMRYSANLGANTDTYVLQSPNNVLVAGIFQGQLYTSLAFNPPPTGAGRGIATIGTGLPTAAAQTLTILPGFPTSGTAAPKSYFFADANTIYIADSSSSALTPPGGLQKWTLNAGTWTQATAPFPYGATATYGMLGLTGTVSGNNVTIYMTTADITAGNSIVKWVSTDGGASGTISTVVAAPVHPGGANFAAFRGIAFAPVAVSDAKTWNEYK